MINRKNNPVGWALLLDELTDAHEHLGDLLKEISRDPDYSEGNLRIDLGHVYAHLNRAWFRRAVPEDFPMSKWDTATRFPGDLEPVA